jgi:succinylglutamic semialdehyde dehydrogenase
MSDLVSYEPATGRELWRAAIGDVDAEVAVARAAQPGWALKPLDERIVILRRFAVLAKERRAEFADLIARETGKPLWEAETEVDTVVNKVDISIRAHEERTGARELGAGASMRHKPHGVLAVLGPYNFPAHLANGHMIPALLAGNAVVFKPSEKTPASGAMLTQLYHEAGVPVGVARLLVGGPDQGRALSAHPGIDGLLFTGSARTGLALNRQFADTPEKILALEMGGNNPLLVWDTEDLGGAAALIVQSAYLTAGQRCTAARRLIVGDGLHQRLITEVERLLDRLIIGAPHDDPQPFLGPVIDNEAADALVAAFLSLVERGGQVTRPLNRPEADKPFLTPALIDVTEVADRPDTELFGPVLQLIRVPDFDAAIAEANATRYGLSASLLGGDQALFDRFWTGVRAGIVNWNKPTNGASSAAPFGGVGLSGNHRPSAYYAADYCAYPVVSTVAKTPSASIPTGLR